MIMALEQTARTPDPAAWTRPGRGRLLAALGTAVFGVAASMARPKGAAAAPYPCHGGPNCSCCSAGVCCASNCPDYYDACGTGTHCWSHSDDVGGGCYHLYSCCDYHEGGGLCICSGDNGVYC